MADSDRVVDNDTPSSLIEHLSEALNELDARNHVSGDKVQWVEIEQHFRDLDTLLKKKIEELDSREKEYEEKEARTRALLVEREAAVVSKEQDFLDRVQLLKDGAVAAIVEARARDQLLSLESSDNKDSKVSSSLGDPNSPEESFTHKLSENNEGVASNIKPRPELMQFCEQMDAKRLVTYAMGNQKFLFAIRKELSVALESASEPARLVLDSLEGFYPLVETTQIMDRRDAALQGKRKSCVMFLEAMAALMARIDPGADHLLNPEIKQQAKAIADEWKPKLVSADFDATNGNSLEADAFLQLLSTFRIASEFDEEELCKLVLVVAHRRQATELCRSLGLTHKMPGIVESLVNTAKQIDAVRFIHAFQLTESYPPVPLLKAYLDDIQRNAQQKSGNSDGTASTQTDGSAEELAAFKAVIRCVEEFKLEADCPLGPLKEKIAQLEKSKHEKRRGADLGKHQQPKKSRANGGHRGFRGRGSGSQVGRQVPPVFAERTTYTAMPVRYPHTGGRNPYNYQVPGQAAYNHQAANQRLHYYPSDDRVTSTTYNAPPNYGGYVDPGTHSMHQPYM